MKKINFTLAMFRIYRILVQCLNKYKKIFKSVPKYLEIINEIRAILENKVIKPFTTWFIDNNPNDSNARRYIQLYYMEARKDNNLSVEFSYCPVDTVKKSVERSMGKYDREKLSKKDTK